MSPFNINDLAQYEALQMLCGQHLGTGAMRSVFDHGFAWGKVVKVAINENGVRANVTEYEVWRQLGDRARPHFAECSSISGSGVILIQERLQTPLPKGKYKVLRYFDDVKATNFGLRLVKGKPPRIVCCDYGYNHLITYGSEVIGTKVLEAL